MDWITVILISLPFYVFGYLYFQWRQRQNATLMQMVTGSFAICFYLAVIFNIVIMLVVIYQSTSITGFDHTLFGKTGEGDIVLSIVINIVLTAAALTVPFLIGGFIQRAAAKRQQATTD